MGFVSVGGQYEETASPSKGGKVQHADAHTQVREVVSRWAEAIDARDIDGIVARHAEDIHFFDVPEHLVEGIDAYRRSFEDFVPWLGEPGFKLSDLTVTAGEDVAFCHALIHCGLTQADEQGTKIERPVRLTVGLRKRDGRWEITHEHHSVPDLAPGGPSELL